MLEGQIAIAYRLCCREDKERGANLRGWLKIQNKTCEGIKVDGQSHLGSIGIVP